MRAPRRNEELNDVVEYLDEKIRRTTDGKNKKEAWDALTSTEMVFVEEEISKCLDAKYYLENYHFIQTNDGRLQSFYPFFDHQEMMHVQVEKEFAERGECKMIVLKPRQAGISTWTAARMFHRTITSPNNFTLLMAQDPTVSKWVFRMCATAYDRLPWWLQPEYVYRQKDYLEFQRRDDKDRALNPGLGSLVLVSHAQKKSGVAIGRTLMNCHLSEASRYPSGDFWEADLKPTIPAQNSFVIIESTGRGRDGFFYQQWQAAEQGDIDFTPFLIPVFKVKKYYLPLKNPKAFVLSEKEEAFNRRVEEEDGFQVPNEFWNWYRKKKKESGATASLGGGEGFKESYPLTADDAFQSSGLCAFDRESLDYQMRVNCMKPRWVGEITLRGKEPVFLSMRQVDPKERLAHRQGVGSTDRLWIWEKPDPSCKYYLGCDVAKGIDGGDYSVAQVFRVGDGSGPDVQVSEWWGHIGAKQFASTIAAMGYWYNECEISVEYKASGITTGDTIRMDLGYPRLYRPRVKDRVNTQMTNYVHFETNSKNRQGLINTMIECLMDKTVVLRSDMLMEEMRDFATLDASGEGTFAGLGNHDDGVFAAMLALYCLRETIKQGIIGVGSTLSGGTVHGMVYYVYDHLMRLRGTSPHFMGACKMVQDNTGIQANSLGMKNEKGWMIMEMPKMKANTEWSVILDERGIPNMMYRDGFRDSSIVPSTIMAYRANRISEQEDEDSISSSSYSDTW